MSDGFLLAALLGVPLYWLVIGLAGLLRISSDRFVRGALFPLGALGALALMLLSLVALGTPPQAATLPLGLPDLPFHVRFDALSAFFLLLLGAASVGISIFSAGYFRHDHG